LKGKRRKEVRTRQKSMMPLSHCWLRRFGATLISTLMKSKTVSKLIRMSFMLQIKSSQFLTWCGESPKHVPNRLQTTYSGTLAGVGDDYKYGMMSEVRNVVQYL
jgi:hypothetical protein